MIGGSPEEAMMRPFAGAQREGIGAFTADPVTGRWWWADVVYKVFGRQRGSVEPSWFSIVEQIPEDERAEVEAAYQEACCRSGPFSWSHRINTGDGRVRSILVLGQTSRSDAAPDGRATADAAGGAAGLYLDGYVVDLTELRLERARVAGNEAVAASREHLAVIEQAKGALMLVYRVDADTAFTLLSWHSQHRNHKLHTVAAELVGQLSTGGLGDCGMRTAIDRVLVGSP